VKRFASIVVFLVAMMAIARPATAMIVTGYNGASYNLNNRNFYIPLKPSTSGVLGKPLGGGKYVGLNSDTVQLSGGAGSSGFVDFTFNFNVSGFTPAEKLFLNDAFLNVTFGDIDFKPVIDDGLHFRESLKLTYADKTPLVIDQSNYGFYTAGFVETNNRTVTYTIGLAGLGITNEDASAIVAAGQLDVAARFSSFLTYEGGQCTASFSNTPETVNCALISPVPEPATSLLFGVSGLMALARRRKNQGETTNACRFGYQTVLRKDFL